MAPAKLTAVLGNCKRIGRWKIRSSTKALVVFGNCSIDYTDAYADDDVEEIKLDVLCLLGRAVFTLPPGANVQPSSVSLLSSSTFDVEHTGDDADLPIIKMQTTTVFGVCKVRTVELEDLALADPPSGETPATLEPPTETVSTSELVTDSGGEVPAVPIPPPPPPLDLPGDPLRSVPPIPQAVPNPGSMTDGPTEGSTPTGRPWLDELDASKAVSIEDGVDTIHIAA